MQVILLENIMKLGKIGDQVEVKKINKTPILNFAL